MHTKFSTTPLSGTNCAATTTSPKIYDCYIRGVTSGSATIMWESDVQVTATVCYNTSAYTTGQCTAAGASTFCQPGGANPGTSLTNAEIQTQQLPSGNWLYSAIAVITTPGTYHYQISLQTSTGTITDSNDATFAIPKEQPTFQDNFVGAAVAASPYFTEGWSGATSVGAGSALFYDKFSKGSTLDTRKWSISSGTWTINSTQGVAQISGPGEAQEIGGTLGSPTNTGEITTSVTLPALTTQYPYDDAGIVIGSAYIMVLDTTASCTWTTSGSSGCANGELSTGIWQGTSGNISQNTAGYNHTLPMPTFAPGNTYYFDIRVNQYGGMFVFYRTSTTALWTLATYASAGGSFTGQPGMWDHAQSATPVQFGAFYLYSTVSSPTTGTTPNPDYYNPFDNPVAVYSPNSTSSNGLLAAAPNGIGVSVNIDNDEVDFSSDNMSGIIARAAANPGAAGDTFSITLSSSGIQGNINGAGSVGVVTGNAPWQLEARFEGKHLSLYGQASGSSAWQFLAGGGDSQYTSGTYVWPQPTASGGVIGAFSIRQVTSTTLADWQGGSNTNPQISTTSNDPNTPGNLFMANGGSDSRAFTQDANFSDGVITTTFTLNDAGTYNNKEAYILFRVQDSQNYYELNLGGVTQSSIGGSAQSGPAISRVDNGNVTTLAYTPSGCSFAVGQKYGIGLVVEGANICANVTSGPSLGSLVCANDPHGWDKPGGVGMGQCFVDWQIGPWHFYTPTIPGGPYDSPGGFCSSNSGSSGCGDPIDIATGSYDDSDTDLVVPGRGIPLTWSRNYNSAAAGQGIKGPLGYGWFDDYERTFTINTDGSVSVSDAGGTVRVFAADSVDGSYTSPASDFDQLVKNGDGSFSLKTRARTVSTFQVVNSGGPYVLTKQTDADGNTTTLSYGSNNALLAVTDPSGRQLTFTYNAQSIGPFAAGQLITQVADGTRHVTYGYDTNGNLATVTDAGGFVTTYVYDSTLNAHLLTKRYDANNNPNTTASPKYLLNQYAADPIKSDGNGGYHVVQQTDPTGIVTKITYNSPGQGDVQVTLDPGSAPHLNETTTYHTNAMSATTDENNAVGTLYQYTYDSDNQPVTIVGDVGSGHVNSTYQWVYDPRGNLLEETDPNGFTIAYSYDDNSSDPQYNQITQVTIDPVPPTGGTHLNAVYTLAYYPQASPPSGFSGNPGDVYSLTDALNAVTRFGYNAAGQRTVVEDANSHYTTYGYDSHGMLSQVTVDPTSFDPGGLNLTTTSQYDSIGRLQSTTDPAGHSVAYTYDNLLQLTQVVVDPYNATSNPQGLNLTTTYGYDPVGNRTAVTTDPTAGATACNTTYSGTYVPGCHMNETTTTVYDADNHIAKVISPINGQQVTYPGASSSTALSGVTTYAYDTAGNVSQITDPNGNSVIMTYDAMNRVKQKINALDGKTLTYPNGTHVANGTTLYTYDVLGRLTQTTDPRGLVTQYTYDKAQDVTSVVVDPNGLKLTQTKSYDSAGRVTAATDARGDATSYAYDANNRVITVQLPMGEQTSDAYDAVGNLTQQIVDPLPQGQTTGHLNLVTQHQYDAANRLTSQTVDPNPPGGTGHLNQVTAYHYDPAGLLLQFTDANNHTTDYSYDHAGREISATDAHAVATGGPAWQFAYDAASNVRTTTDALGNVTAMQYDVLNQPIQEVIDPNPSGGSGHLALTRSQYYDSDGNVVDTTNANGQTTAFAYDALNRLITIQYNSATTPNVGLYYDDSGNRLYMTDGTGASGTFWSYAYDASGRPTSVTDPASHTIQYGYDANGQKGLPTGITYPSGHSLALTYDLDNRPTALSSPNNALFGSGTASSTTSFQYSYDGASRLTGMTYPNGVSLTYGYNAASQLTGLTATQNGTGLASWAYTRDNVGNPTLITDSTVGGTGKTAYAYDEANRLTSASYWDGTSQTYTYDAAGNRSGLTTTTGTGSNTIGYTYDAAGRMTAAGGTTYAYDSDGNRTSATTGGTTTTYGYDQANRLISTGGGTGPSATYTYNGDGLRIAKTVSGTTTAYQWDPLSQTLLSDSTNEYVDSGASGGLLVQTPLSAGASGALFGIADALGSTRLLTNTTAQTQGSFAYDAFGVPKNTTGTATSPLGFAGQLTDGETGFQDLRARLYDPQTGQFLSRDTYGGSSGNPLSLNRYTYGHSDPTLLVDPSGHNVVQAIINDGLCLVQTIFDVPNLVAQAVTNNWDTVSTVLSYVLPMVPVVGSAYMFTDGLLGRDLLTGKALTDAQAKQMMLAGVTGLILDGVGGAYFQPFIGEAGDGVNELSGLSRLLSDAGSGEGDLSGLGRDLSGGYQDLGSGSRLGGDAPPEESGGTTPGGPCGGAYSFSPDTRVATPHGQQPIGSLKVGDVVEAYNPTTGKPEAEPIQTIWVNHDHDLVDVHLAPAGSSSSAHMPVALRTSGHGHIIGDDATATVRLATPSTTHTAAGGETIHTTANHPWLTSDRGWIEAGQLQVGEAVVTLYGSSGTVAWVHVVPGQADMYNLTVAHDHTYAVGGGQWVVHNDDLPPGSLITEVGQSFVEKIRALGVEVDMGSEQANAYGRFAEANGGTQFWGNSPADTYVWFTNAAKDHTVYEEYQHILRGAARGWTSTSSDQMNLEEAQVKTEVLNHADELGMTTEERQAMQKQADDYMKKYNMKNGGCP